VSSWADAWRETSDEAGRGELREFSRLLNPECDHPPPLDAEEFEGFFGLDDDECAERLRELEIMRLRLDPESSIPTHLESWGAVECVEAYPSSEVKAAAEESVDEERWSELDAGGYPVAADTWHELGSHVTNDARRREFEKMRRAELGALAAYLRGYLRPAAE